MKNLVGSVLTFLNVTGFMTLFTGVSLVIFHQRTAEAKAVSICYTCPCLYPNSGWCDTNANVCGYGNSGCGCDAFNGCSPFIVPNAPEPY